MIHYPNPIQSRQHSLQDGINMSKGGRADPMPTTSSGNNVTELQYRPTTGNG